MSLDTDKFDKIINLLVKAYMSYAIAHIKERPDGAFIPFEQELNNTQLLQDYMNELKIVYGVSDEANLPPVYRTVCNEEDRIRKSFNLWGGQRRVLVELRALDLHAVARQLNQDFSEQHSLPEAYHLSENQVLGLTFMLRDQPSLLQQIMALPQSHLNKVLIGILILSAILAVVYSAMFLIPTALAAIGLFVNIKKPGHREQFFQHAEDCQDLARRGDSMMALLEEQAQSERALANF